MTQITTDSRAGASVGCATASAASTPWWQRVLVLTLILLAVRVAYLLWLSPYELAADEAQYWDWSRTLSLSYYTKGPGVAVVIRVATELFGVSAGAIRLPAAVSAAVTMLATAWLAWRVALFAGGLVPPISGVGDRAGGDGRGAAGHEQVLAHVSSGGTSPPADAAALVAAALVALMPAYAAVSQFMTIDMPYIACWAVACAVAWWVMVERRGGHAGWALLGTVLGIGFLFKYTILLLVVGLVLFAVGRRRRSWSGAAIALVTFAVASGPVWLWNHLHGWPTVAHLLGHLHAPGGDMAPQPGRGWLPMWMVEYVACQLAIVGPPIWVLIGLGLSRAWRRRDVADRFLVACGLPILLFYTAVALVTDAEANWPIAGYVTLLVLAARAVPGELARYRDLVARWKADPDRTRRGLLRRKPETFAQVAWHWAIGVGVVATLGIMLAPLARHLPRGAGLPGIDRITGHETLAQEADQLARILHEQTGQQPMIITDRYSRTALLAFYMPGRPTVYSAAHQLGSRPSAYDQFARTDLTDAALVGRPALLMGASPERWQYVLGFERVEPAATLDGRPFFFGYGYGGPR